MSQVKAFLFGAAHALDIGATLGSRNISRIIRDDNVALASDWSVVGSDISIAFGQHEQKRNEKQS